MLAREGFTGPAPIFEGEMGFFAEVAHGEFELPDLGGRNGAEYMLPSTYIKNWPAEYHASDDSSFVTGQALAVDGGFTAGHRVGFTEMMNLD